MNDYLLDCFNRNLLVLFKVQFVAGRVFFFFFRELVQLVERFVYLVMYRLPFLLFMI